MCTNKGGHKNALSVGGTKHCAFKRRDGMLLVMPVDSPVDLTFEQSKNITIEHIP